MSRWLLLAFSSFFLLSTAACSEKEEDKSEEDDDGESKKKKKGKKKKGPHERKVLPECTSKLGYLKSSKTSEAKNTIGAISRGAAAAYERERAVDELSEGDEAAHQLCKSAQPVPADGPPKGKKYQPDTSDGNDFNTGDAETGWRCLKFAMTQPHYYQYGYNAGSGYKSKEYGLPDPGPNGFEAWAMGDLDGDGIPSLFVRVGRVNPETKKLKMNTVISCVDPGE